MPGTPPSPARNMSQSLHSYPERDSSLSAVEYPYGPPNTPQGGVEAVVLDGEIPALDLASGSSDSDSGAPRATQVNGNNAVNGDEQEDDGEKDAEETDNQEDGDRNGNTKDIILVAIGGSLSSGKTTMAKILSEVFNQHVSLDESSKEGKNVKEEILISQDDFFLPKSLQPVTTFVSTPAEAAFIYASLKHDQVGNYYIVSSGTRPLNPPDTLPPCTEGSHRNHPKRSDSESSTSTAASRVFEGGHRPIYQVTGPMPDCNEAIDFVGLYAALNSVKQTGEEPAYQYAKRFPFPSDMTSYVGAMGDMHMEIDEFIKALADANAEAGFSGFLVKGPVENDEHGGSNGKATLRPAFVFVEGFLLLAEPDTLLSTLGEVETAYDSEAEKRKVLSYTHRLESIALELEAKGGIDANLEGERETIESQLWAVNALAKKNMQSLFDIRLFLSPSKAVAKHHRFSRLEYTDAPTGGRLPGQMWKSEGYFEQVVWPQFEKEYEWLRGPLTKMDGEEGEVVDGEAKGVLVVPRFDGGDMKVMELTAMCAVHALLREIGRIEGKAREQARGCASDN